MLVQVIGSEMLLALTKIDALKSRTTTLTATLTAQGSQLRIAGQGAGCDLLCYTGSRVALPGQAVLDTRTLLAAIKAAPRTLLTLALEGDGLVIERADHKQVIPCLPATAQIVEEGEALKEEFVTIDSRLLKKIVLLGDAYSAAAPQSLRRLTLCTKDGLFEAWAGNGRASMFHSQPMGWDIPDRGADMEVGIRKSHLKVVSALLLPHDLVKISVSADWVFIDTRNCTLRLARLSDDSPAEMIAAQHVNNTATVFATSLLDALLQVKEYAEPRKAAWARLTAESGILRVTSSPYTDDDRFSQSMYAVPGTAGGWIEVEVAALLPLVRQAKAAKADVTLQFDGYNAWANRPQNQRLLVSSPSLAGMLVAVEGKDRIVENV